LKIVTGNDLKTGAVIWWAGDGWSIHVADAVDAGEHADALAQTEQAALRVNGAYVIDGEATPNGPRPAHIKERIRAIGPTVRPDLNLEPADPAAGSWVI